MKTLKRRADFLAASGGRKWVSRGFVMQVVESGKSGREICEYGLTATKRMGNAVERNRAKRRLRALARETLSRHAVAGFNYVLIARAGTLTEDYAAMRAELGKALKKFNLWRGGEK